MHDFLNEPLIPIDNPDGSAEVVSLPALLARLSQGTVVGFPGLIVHQRQPWYQFLVQLAAIALDRDGRAALPPDAAVWRTVLAALTPDLADSAWSLVVEDSRRPALFQPPSAEGGLDGYGPLGDTPDAIDILVTAKNHDVKAARMGAAAPHHWLYALVTLQTLQGFLGAGNYGIARMNGGFASRVQVDAVPDLDWGARFRSGVALLLDQRRRGSPLSFQPATGKALLWLEAWNGEDRLILEDLDPHFIEVCRRVRLVRAGGTGASVALGRTTRAARIEAKDYKGAVDDPWIPVDPKNAAALTVGGGGFHYRKLVDILYGDDYEPPASLCRGGEAAILHCQVLVHGQGKTDGHYERTLPARHLKALARRDAPERALLHKLAQRMIEDAAAVKKALKRGLVVLLNGGFPADPAKPLKFDDNRPDRWLDDLDLRIDEIFFAHLWTLADAGGDDARAAAATVWQRDLRTEAELRFESALDQMPAPSARRERARAHAQAAFRSALGKALDHLTQPQSHGTAP